MARLLFLAVLGVSSLVVLASCGQLPLPVVVPVTKDTATSLHTIPFADGANLVVDIGSPLVWSTSTCHLPGGFPCGSGTCMLANAYPVAGCQAASCGPDSTCTAYPYNPVTGACAAGSLVQTRFVANTTDGSNPVSQVSLTAVSACGSGELLQSLPRGATGVAGLADSGLALPAQVASAQKVSKTFLLCLSPGVGVAIFGGGAFYLTAAPETDYTQLLEYAPLVTTTRKGGPEYSVTARYIALDTQETRQSSRVPLPAGALAAGGVVLRTTAPYTLLRTDVYRPFLAAFRQATPESAQEVSPVDPFGLCYSPNSIPSSLSGYHVPAVTLALEGGKNWTMLGDNSMVYVKPANVLCLAIVEMDGGDFPDAPAVVLGAFQMENFVLRFDLDKKRLGFVGVPGYTSCAAFNFTRAA